MTLWIRYRDRANAIVDMLTRDRFATGATALALTFMLMLTALATNSRPLARLIVLTIGTGYLLWYWFPSRMTGLLALPFFTFVCLPLTLLPRSVGVRILNRLLIGRGVIE